MTRRYRAAAYWRGGATVDAPPATLAVETTTCCNLECVGCLRRWDTMPARHMDDEVFAAAVAWPGLESVLLYGLGEPLLDPQIFARLAAAKSRDLFVQLSTNATLLDADRRRALVDAGPDVIVFSLDAADPGLYRAVRGGADFEQTVANVAETIKLVGARPIQTVIQMVVLPENRHAIPAFRERFRRLGATALRFKHDETLPRRRAAQDRARARACPVLFAGPLFVRVDGTVLPCCHMLAEAPLGRLPHDDPDALWHAPRLQALRVMHGAGRINEIDACRLCSLPLPPRFVGAGALLTPPRLFRRVLPLAERLVE
jgi:pyruvate-formate lyase-activating enzyme